MVDIYLRIQQNGYKYGKYIVNYDQICKYDSISEVLFTSISQMRMMNLRKRIKAVIDGICLHYLLQELKYCPKYRKKYVTVCSRKSNRIVFELIEPKQQIIDYEWNQRIDCLVRERSELEHALSWLSTLGGACSALGDYFENFALVAGKISYQQLALALRMGDPTVASRCRLYYSISLIQQQQFKQAKQIIYNEYNTIKNAVIVDTRLIKMCFGIWSKLQYEHQLALQSKKLLRLHWK